MLKMYKWFQADSDGLMTCNLCMKHKKMNSMRSGSKNYRTSTLVRHAESRSHKEAVLGEHLQPQFKRVVHKALSEKEEAVIVAFKTVY